MSRTITSSLTLLALCLSGCAFSIAPLATGENLVDDPDLSGTWEVISKPRTRDVDLPGAEDLQQFTLERVPRTQGSYWMETGDKQHVFCVDLLKLDDVLYLELSYEEAHNRLYSLPLYQVFRVSAKGDELRLSVCDMRKLAELVAKTNQRHVCRDLDIVLIGTTEELQQFYRKHGGEIFGKGNSTVLRRSQTGADSERSKS